MWIEKLILWERKSGKLVKQDIYTNSKALGNNLPNKALLKKYLKAPKSLNVDSDKAILYIVTLACML